MALLTIDEEKCKRDGFCVRECPFMLINQTDSESVPFTNPGSEKVCINCGHCVAVCPHGALSHEKMKMEACPSIKKELIVGIDQVEQLFRTRRSIRLFKDQVIPQKDLEKLIDLAHYAPTAHNDQDVQWLVISGFDNVKKFSSLAVDSMRDTIKNNPGSTLSMSLGRVVGAWDMGIDVVTRNAPHLIITHAEYETSPVSEFYPTDCATALSYVELAAPVMGIGTCWNGMFSSNVPKWKPLQDALGIPETNRCYGALTAGYPKVKYYRMPLRNAPRVIWNQG